jgi:elongation factor 1-alpha
MITGASQADVAVVMVPADGNFTTAIARGNHKAGVVQGQTRQHARLINLLGVKQLVIGVNKMDCDVAKYSKDRYEEIKAEMKSMLCKVGWKKSFVAKSVPIIPISGWMGDNLVTKSTNMDWWKGVEVINANKDKILVHTLVDAFNDMVVLPSRDGDKPMRTPVSGVYKIKGVGDVVTGRVEQGQVCPGNETVFLPTHTASLPCTGKVFTVEMHHQNQEKAECGDNVGLNMKGLNKTNMPRVGDVMIDKKEVASGSGLWAVQDFTAQVQILDHPGELKVGYTPIAFVRTARAAIRMSKIAWKIGKSTGGQKVEEPPMVKANEMAAITFEPQQPFVCDGFKNCEGLGRIAIMEGNGVVMLGKVVKVTQKPRE